MTDTAFLETGGGTYILLLDLQQRVDLRVGRLGTYAFPAGWYAYVGSAFGAGGLRGRLKHHLAPVRKPHWHLDYLRQFAVVREVWYAVSEQVYEHAWAAALSGLPGAAIPVRRFGASDCRCQSHLFHFENQPALAVFREITTAAVCRWTP